MFQKIKNTLLVAATLFGFGVLLLAPAGLASADQVTNGVCDGIGQATTGSTGGDCDPNGSSDSLKTLAARVVNIFSVIVGIIAVIFIIFGGFKYITSGGDSNNVSGAKNTLIYAIVGLIIVALAQFIVKYVFSTAVSAGGNGS
ncbi:MAG: rane protein [Candidatus Saccharibacteria bacterium]|nr:rane protein [Candidatus Saccharibacteria bacterium]